MTLFLWIAVGIVLAALLLGLIFRARTRQEQVWENLVDPDAPPNALQSQDQFEMDDQEHPNSRGEEMNHSTTTSTSRSAQDADLRRSSRVERPVPLLILGTNRSGEHFQEKTAAVAVNLHGCRYSSRHEYAPESWVTLQVTGTDGASSSSVRARVRSVLSTQTSRELYQVGVELETPGNVWGIPAPPEDWQRLLDTNNSSDTGAAAAAPALAPAAAPNFLLERESVPSERRAEVTVFPGPPTHPPAAAPTEVSPAKDPASAKAERVVVNAEQLLQVLQGKIQGAADKAVQISLSAQLDDAVTSALAKIDDGWKAHVRQTEESSSSRLAEVQKLWEKDLFVYRSRVEEIARRIESLTANSQQTLSDTQKYVSRFASETAPQLQARINDVFGRAGNEFEAKVAQVTQQHLAQISQSTQLAAREARSHLDESIAEVRSLLSTASGSVSQERVESLLCSFKEETLSHLEKRLGELHSGFEQQHDLARHRTSELVREIQGLASETRQARSQQEESLSELHSLLAEAKAGVSQETMEALLNSAREQIHSQFEWRLGEVSGQFEQHLGRVRNRAEELALQTEKLSSETRIHLAEARSLTENPATRDLRPEDLSAIERAIGRATDEFEIAAARASDRQLVRLMEQKQALSQEVSLELEARASEVRALLQKTANSTLEEFRRRVAVQIDLVLSEAKESITSSLASLDAQSRVAVEARRRALETDVARAAEQSTMEFRSGIKAFLYSCLVAAVGAVDQHAQTTLAGLTTDPNGLQRALEAAGSSPSSPDDAPTPSSNDPLPPP
jgi:hypothetical protein